MLRMLSLIASIVVLSNFALADSSSPFTFQIPPGWVDVSPSAPAENFAKIPPEFAARLHDDPEALFIAADPDHPSPGGLLTLEMVSMIDPRPAIVTKKIVDEVAASASGGATIRETSVLDINGVSVGKFIGDIAAGDSEPAAILGYLLPSPRGLALMRFTTTRDRLATDEPQFQSAMAATTGLGEKTSVGMSGMRLAGIFAACLVLGAAINFLRRFRS